MIRYYSQRMLNRLAFADFPELMLCQDWSSPADTALVEAFLSWQAPWLLALQYISRAIRRRLEPAAREQALLLDRLYPRRGKAQGCAEQNTGEIGPFSHFRSRFSQNPTAS